MEALVRANGGIERDEWGHWSASMGVLKGSMVALKRVNEGIGQGQWRY